MSKTHGGACSRQRPKRGERRPLIGRCPVQSTARVVGLFFQLALLFATAAVGVVGEDGQMDGTLMFLHVWKCGGTTLRELMCDWANSEGLPCATVAGCGHLSLKERKVCLLNHKLIFPEQQGEFIARQKVLAGHFRWGFQVYAAEPHWLVTTLRNPLELFVSGEQYLNRAMTATLSNAVQVVDRAMRKSLESPTQPPGYLHRLVGRSVVTNAEIREATVEGARNLKTFWLVGVVEQYGGFVAVLRALLDPDGLHDNLWRPQLEEHKLNASPVQSSNVLASLDPQLVKQFNSTLSYQWLMYGHAVRLFKARCQEVLPEHQHWEFCSVQQPPVEYTS
ncbi:unnamed protein product [Ectocarpus sp. 12 AP-2014]